MSIDESDFLLLRTKVDEAVNELRHQPLNSFSFEKVAGGDLTDESVSVNALFLSTITALAKATRKLKASNIAIDMSSNPIEIQFTGSIVGIDKKQGEIYLKLNK